LASAFAARRAASQSCGFTTRRNSLSGPRNELMMIAPADLLDTRTYWLLVLAHPGHELCAYHFIERVKPTVAVLTDGSGSNGASRLHETAQLLASVGARPGPMFGAMPDRDAYAALMAGESGVFDQYVEQLADYIVANRVRAVVADAAEGYNPVHDVCHWMARAAVDRAALRGCSAELFEIDLIARPGGQGDGLRLALDDDAFARKLEAVNAYQALAGEAQAAFERHGVDAFRTEFVRAAGDASIPAATWVPYFEEVGRSRVRSGLYTSVLTYSGHVRPVIEALARADATPADEPADRSLNQ
jgi:hypothetical protein